MHFSSAASTLSSPLAAQAYRSRVSNSQFTIPTHGHLLQKVELSMIASDLLVSGMPHQG
jgi:hypothetical protein